MAGLASLDPPVSRTYAGTSIGQYLAFYPHNALHSTAIAIIACPSHAGYRNGKDIIKHFFSAL